MTHIKSIEQEEFAAYSTAWFLLKYLRRIAKTTETPTNAGRVEGAMRSLLRFYIDNIDERSELGDQCMKIYNEYRKTIRMSQSE